MKPMLKILVLLLAFILFPAIVLPFIMLPRIAGGLSGRPESATKSLDYIKKNFDATFQDLQNKNQDLKNDPELLDTFAQVLLYPEVEMYQRSLIDLSTLKMTEKKLARLEIGRKDGIVLATGSSAITFNYPLPKSYMPGIAANKTDFRIEWIKDIEENKIIPMLIEISFFGASNNTGIIVTGIRIDDSLLPAPSHGRTNYVIIHTKEKILFASAPLLLSLSQKNLAFDKIKGVKIGNSKFDLYRNELLEKELYVSVLIKKGINSKESLSLGIILILYFLLLLAGIFGAFLFFRLKVEEPTKRMSTILKKCFGNTHPPVADIATLEIELKALADDLGRQKEKLLQTERVAAWREVARKLAHEIKNPLFPIQVSVENLKRNYDKLPKEKQDKKYGEALNEAVNMTLDEIAKMTRIIQDFSEYARMPPPVIRPENLNEVIQNTIHLHSGIRPMITRKISLADNIPLVPMDRDKIQQVLVNLIKNSLEAIEETGTITISTALDETRKEAVITVSDSGKGMDPDTLAKVFLPYFTTKKTGTGLGLAICQRIIADHDGVITVSSKPGEGAHFQITLPLRDQI